MKRVCLIVAFTLALCGCGASPDSGAVMTPFEITPSPDLVEQASQVAPMLSETPAETEEPITVQFTSALPSADPLPAFLTEEEAAAPSPTTTPRETPKPPIKSNTKTTSTKAKPSSPTKKPDNSQDNYIDETDQMEDFTDFGDVIDETGQTEVIDENSIQDEGYVEIGNDTSGNDANVIDTNPDQIVEVLD